MTTRQTYVSKGESGFTLIELLAVMAILAVLVAIVSPAVTGTKDSSIAAQVLQDATQVRTGAAEFFTAQDQAEVRTPHSVTLTTTVNALSVPATVEKISSKWPEKFFTTGNSTNFLAIYADVLPTSTSATSGKVVDVTLKDKEGHAITGATFLSKFTAVDLDTLVSQKRLSKKPAGADLTSTTGITGVNLPTFLWLFEKTDSSADRQEDNREVAVFELSKVEKNEGSGTNLATTVNLSYDRIF